VSPGVFPSRRPQNVQETRGSVVRHGRSRGCNGPEDDRYDPRRRLGDDGGRFRPSAANALESRQRTGTADTVESGQRAGATNALVKDRSLNKG